VELPEDPMMLFSMINLKLRDFYDTLEELCAQEDINQEVLCAKLATVGFEYNPEQNKFW